MRSFSAACCSFARRRAARWRNDEFDCGLVVEVGIMAFGGFVCLRENLARDVILGARVMFWLVNSV